MKALVTGASGFVGNAVVRALLASGHEVRALCRPGSNRKNLEGLSVEIIEGDLMRPETLADTVKGCTGVFHVAADYRLWVPDPDAMYRANVDGTKALLHAASEEKVGRIIYTSSVATLKVSADTSVSDERCIASEEDMIGHYKRSKYLAERVVREEITAGLPAVMVSPSAPIGPRDIKPTPTGKIIVDAANGKMPAYLDTGLNVVHVDDVATGHLLAYEKGVLGENYILGGENMLLKEILQLIAKIMGRKAPTLQLSPAVVKPIAMMSECVARLTKTEAMVPLDGVRMAEKKMFFSHVKATRELGYQPQSASRAIEDALDWFIEYGYITRQKVGKVGERGQEFE